MKRILGSRTKVPGGTWKERRKRMLMWRFRRAGVRVGMLAVMYKRQGMRGDKLRKAVLASGRSNRMMRPTHVLMRMWRHVAWRLGSEVKARRRANSYSRVASELVYDAEQQHRADVAEIQRLQAEVRQLSDRLKLTNAEAVAQEAQTQNVSRSINV